MTTGVALFGRFAGVLNAFSPLWVAMGVTTGVATGTKPTSGGHAPVYVKLQNEAFRILVPYLVHF